MGKSWRKSFIRRFLVDCGLFALLGFSTNARAEEPLRTQLRLMLPLSGIGIVGRDKVTAPDGGSYYRSGDEQLNLLGLSAGQDLSSLVTSELYAALITSDGLKPRGLFGLRVGPQFTVGDWRKVQGTGPQLRMAGLLGLAYRGRLWDWVHTSDWQGQSSLAVNLAPSLDLNYFTSRNFALNLRARTEFSYVVAQFGDKIWSDGEGGPREDGYRWGLGAGLDIGVVF
jgi:hypothetical protein